MGKRTRFASFCLHRICVICGLVAAESKHILYGSKSAGFHSIDVQRSDQMVYLVLKNPRVPTLRINRYLFAPFIQTFNANLWRTSHNRLEACYAEAAFEEFYGGFIQEEDFRIDDHVKRYRRSLTICK